MYCSSVLISTTQIKMSSQSKLGENVLTMVRPTLGPVLVNGLANSMLMVQGADRELVDPDRPFCLPLSPVDSTGIDHSLLYFIFGWSRSLFRLWVGFISNWSPHLNEKADAKPLFSHNEADTDEVLVLIPLFYKLGIIGRIRERSSFIVFHR